MRFDLYRGRVTVKQTVLGMMLLLGLAACGAPGVLGPASVIDEWTAQMPEQRLRDKCTQSGGTLIDTLTVGPCTGGRVHLTPSGELAEQDQDCASGTGGAYGLQCVQTDAQGLLYWQDGPSVPNWLQAVGPSISEKFDPARWTFVAWDAAVNHDYCYHHNGSTYGYGKADCDQQFFADLSALCASDTYKDQSWFTRENCRVNAAAMFAAVQVAGDAPWNIMDSHVQYPDYAPLWKTLGLDADVSDPVIKELADRFTSGSTGS